MSPPLCASGVLLSFHLFGEAERGRVEDLKKIAKQKEKAITPTPGFRAAGEGAEKLSQAESLSTQATREWRGATGLAFLLLSPPPPFPPFSLFCWRGWG